MIRPPIEEIRARADAATPGPWCNGGGGNAFKNMVYMSSSSSIYDRDVVQGGGFFKDVDAEFAAHARTDIPALLDYVADLECVGGDQTRRVIVESPYAGDVEKNLRYLRACLRDSIMRGEAPFASHGLYTQDGVLDDGFPPEMELGMRAGWAWREVSVTVVYGDLGLTPGMLAGVEDAQSHGQAVEFRLLGKFWDKKETE